MISPTMLLSHLPESPVIVEAGAWRGTDTMKLSSRARCVYAFEPVPEMFKELELVTRWRENVRVFPLALGEESEQRMMWVSQGAVASSSLLEPTLHISLYPHIDFEQKLIEVSVVRLDAWAQHENVKKIDGLWLDAQGSELDILKGMGDLLNDVQAMIIEFCTAELYAGSPLWDEVNYWLTERGFSTIFAEAETAHHGNALVVRQ